MLGYKIARFGRLATDWSVEEMTLYRILLNVGLSHTHKNQTLILIGLPIQRWSDNFTNINNAYDYLLPQKKRTMTYADGISGPGLGWVQKCGGVKPVNEIPTLTP